jgi:hypothetical protein
MTNLHGPIDRPGMLLIREVEFWLVSVARVFTNPMLTFSHVITGFSCGNIPGNQR